MIIKKFLVLIMLSLISLAAYAGHTAPQPVTINFNPDGSGWAAGDLISARNSKNMNEFIGCGVRIWDDGAGGVFNFGFCQANLDSDAGLQLADVRCNTDDPRLIAAMAALVDSSYIVFEWIELGPDDYQCTMIGNSVNSFYLEKGKPNK